MDPSEKYEDEYVHKVYNDIAQSFDTSRIFKWTYVQNFIDQIPLDNDIKIGDIGCGNGKYMLSRKDQFIGCDMCEKLVEICRNKGLNVKIGNILSLPFENDYFDYVICIAMLHHLSTIERRISAIKELVRTMKKNAKAVITVWALENENEHNKKKNIFTENGTKQDVMVPWITVNGKHENMEDRCYTSEQAKLISQTPLRYYHMFKEDELVQLCSKVEGITIIDSKYEHGNWNIIIQKNM